MEIDEESWKGKGEAELKMLRGKKLERVKMELDEEFMKQNEPYSLWTSRVLGLLGICVLLETLYWYTILTPVGFLKALDVLLTFAETVGIIGLAGLLIMQAIQAQRYEAHREEVLAPYQNI